MSIFKKNEPQPNKPRERAVPQTRAGASDGAISIIGYGMSVVGDIITEGIVRIEGEVTGTVRAAKSVILGQGGFVRGNIHTDDAVIGGTVDGSIEATNRLELQSSSTVSGEIRTRSEHLKLEEGARFTGQVQMLDDSGGGNAFGREDSQSDQLGIHAASPSSENNMFAEEAGVDDGAENAGDNSNSDDSSSEEMRKKSAV